MSTYFHAPSVRFLKPALKIGVGIAASASILSLVGLGFSVISLSAQQHTIETAGKPVRSVWDSSWADVGGVVLMLLVPALIMASLFLTIAKDMDGTFAFQRDGRDFNADRTRKLHTMSVVQAIVGTVAILPFTIMASTSNDLGFMSLVFFGGASAMLLTPQAVALARTLMFRAEQRAAV